MITALKLKAPVVAALPVLGLLTIRALGGSDGRTTIPPVKRPSMVEILPGTIAYRMAGAFNQAGRPVGAPLAPYRLQGALDVMRHQVTVAEYERCVAAQACEKLAASANQGSDHPAVQVSWEDAAAYAAWLSASTGEVYRLPTDEEWAYAAGGRFRDDGLEVVDPKNPSKRWLARYDREAAGGGQADTRTRPVGGFGANERGLLDVSGNVWEWTNTCFVRRSLDADGRPEAAAAVNCGVRVVEGAHRTYLPNFIRDARAGGCAAGEPPSNLGFRLVREPESRLSRAVRALRVSILALGKPRSAADLAQARAR